MVDPESTGRKRAAQLWPLFREQPCEWQRQKNCGGGLFPITGCMEGMQQHRQHGPVKDTRYNEPGNVHRICATCHNRWHTLNDPVYDEELYKTLLHNPEPAAEDDLVAADLWWELKTKHRELLPEKVKERLPWVATQSEEKSSSTSRSTPER